MSDLFTRVESRSFARRMSIVANSLLILAIVVFTMVTLEDVLKPFFIALGIYFVLKPGADFLSKNGFPQMLSFLTMMLLFLLVVSLTMFFAWHQINELATDEEKMDEYYDNLGEKWSKLGTLPFVGPMLNESLETGGQDLDKDLAGLGIVEEGKGIEDSILSMMSGVGDAILVSVTVLFFLIFIIFEANLLPGRIARAYPHGISRVADMNSQIQRSVNKYIIVKTGCGIGTAFIAAVIMVIFGIDLWFVWALLTFLLNYVPYIGSLIATIPPIVLGLILLSPTALIVLALLLLLNQQIWGNIIETKWAGRALDISPVLLLIVTAFSFWLWGITGMILAVPFVVIIKIMLENIDETRAIAILMSERAPTFEEAWVAALKDGRIDPEEARLIEEMRQLEGISDHMATIISGRVAIERALHDKEATQTEVKLIKSSAFEIGQKIKITSGSFNERELLLLGELLDSLNEEE